MQIAIDAAGFTPGEADQLRQAMGSKRSKARMAVMRERLMAGMATKGIVGETAEEIATKLEAFASFGFPESHSVSFAYLVYASSWIKLHYPAEFACALLNAQPMGFYSPHTIVRDAVRHGVRDARAVRRPVATRLHARAAHGGCRAARVGRVRGGTPIRPPTRCGSGCATCAGCPTRCSTASTPSGPRAPFVDLEDFTRRTAAPVDALESLATAGAFACFDVGRRDALWAAGALRDARPQRQGDGEAHTLPGVVTGVEAPPLPGMNEIEETAADLWAVGLSASRHPTEFVRDRLTARGAVTAEALRTLARPHGGGGGRDRHPPPAARDGQGRGVHQPRGRDRPGQRDLHRPTCGSASARSPAARRRWCVRGLLERRYDVVNLLARRIEPLSLASADLIRSRDFR